MKKVGPKFCSYSITFLIIALCTRYAAADDQISFADGELTLVKPYGFLAFENGEIVSGMSPTSGASMNHGWLDRMIMQVSDEFVYKERAKLYMSLEAQLGFTYPQDVIDRSTYLSRFWLYPARMEGTYSLGNIENPYLQFGLGYFPYQANMSVRNLGEFLFRSGTYPPFLVNNFNQPFTRLLGFRATSFLWGSLQQDLLFTSDAQIFPTMDFALSYVAHYTIANCLQIGAGITFSHLISVNSQLTSPTSFQNSYDSLAAMYITKNGDTAYYTFQGTKPDIMFSFDPKPLLPSGLAKRLGADDGKIYGEACVIGWEDYKNYNTDTNLAFPDYNNRWDRAVGMLGFNVPTFNLFDVLTAEVEYKPTRYPNSYKNVIDDNLPIPEVAANRTIDPLKWSIYFKKTFLKKFSLIGQVARDHMRPNVPLINEAERDDVLFRPGDWWWALRLTVKY